MTDSEELELPKWLIKRIKGQMKDGVTFSLNWRGENHLKVTAIHWRPGARNALAKAIIKRVTEEPIPLELDGHLYLIHRAEGTLVSDDDGGERFKPL